MGINDTGLTNRLIELAEKLAGGKYTVFARNAGVPVSTMQRYISGKIGQLPIHLNNIQLRYNVNLNWLVSGNGNMFIDHMEDSHVTIGSNVINGESIKAAQSINTPDQGIIEHVVPIEKKLLLMEKLEEKKAQGLMTEAQYQKAMDELWGVVSGTAPPLPSD